MATRPADVRIDDLASPRFPADVEAIRTAMTAMGADLHLEPDELLAAAAEQTGLPASASRSRCCAARSGPRRD